VKTTSRLLAPCVIVLARNDSMPFAFTQHEIENQIREEFRAAFDELERASGRDKAEATERLNQATRRLYDFVGYRKLPQDSQFERYSRQPHDPVNGRS
jgi:hypothetical protein